MWDNEASSEQMCSGGYLNMPFRLRRLFVGCSIEFERHVNGLEKVRKEAIVTSFSVPYYSKNLPGVSEGSHEVRN